MVNIKSIITLQNGVVLTFDSYETYWQHTLACVNAEQRNRITTLRQVTQTFEQAVALQYGVPYQYIQYISFIFGTIKEARSRIDDYETRIVLINPANRVVVQVRSNQYKSYFISTVHKPFGHLVYTSIIDKPASDNPDTEP